VVWVRAENAFPYGAEIKMLKRHPHAPAHLMVDDTPYFLTGAIYDRRPLLRVPAIKEALLEMIGDAFSRLGWRLDDWVILDNHYHLLAQSRVGTDLPRIFMDLHGRSGKLISQITRCGLPVWWNYWDYCPRDEADYRVRQNYLFYNPVRHGYVEDLNQYPYSSFPRLLARQGRATLAAQFRTHSGFRHLHIKEDDF
jgi:putative transposase